MLQLNDKSHSKDRDRLSECIHCQLPFKKALYLKDDKEKLKPFCCYGCMSVFQVLQGDGLEHFYQLKKDMGSFRGPSPAQVLDERFDYMDREDFLQDYVQQTFEGQSLITLYLDGVHCVACLWLIEKLPEYSLGVIKAQLNAEDSVLKVWTSPGTQFAPIARKLNSFGFTPHPLKVNESSDRYKKDEDRRDILRIGIAGAGAMNVMLYSISLYAGAPEAYTSIFGIIIVLFFIPAITYSAWPFYKAAWHTLKNRKLSLDLPISLALIYGSARGVIEVFQGGREFYFDTLSVLVFLLLISRYIVKKWGRQGLSLNSLSSFLGLKAVEQRDPITLEWKELHPDYLKKDDIIRIRIGQTLPVDGRLLSKKSQLQTSMITGEPEPQEKKEGEEVFAGYQNAGEALIYQVSSSKDESLLAQLLREVEVEQTTKTFYSSLADKISSKLVFGILTLSIALFTYFAFKGEIGEGERRALSLIIITCPCALGLSTPLALARTLKKAQEKGIVLKDESIFERMTQVKNIVLDKTGTLTDGKFGLLSKESEKKDSNLFDIIVKGLEAQSQHPIAKALYNSLDVKEAKIQNLKEILGHGVEGYYQGRHYQLKPSQKKYDQSGATKILALYEDQQEVSWYVLGDKIREEGPSIIRDWSVRGKSFWMISGDSKHRVLNTANELHIRPEQVFWSKLPRDKAALIETLSPVAMIGDGANDSLALKKADVAIAVRGSMPLALKTCSVYFLKDGLDPLNELFKLSESAVTLIKRNLRISLIYNIVGSTLAIFGYITPLSAAIIMPISSFTVLGATLLGTSKVKGER